MRSLYAPTMLFRGEAEAPQAPVAEETTEAEPAIAATVDGAEEQGAESSAVAGDEQDADQGPEPGGGEADAAEEEEIMEAPKEAAFEPQSEEELASMEAMVAGELRFLEEVWIPAIGDRMCCLLCFVAAPREQGLIPPPPPPPPPIGQMWGTMEDESTWQAEDLGAIQDDVPPTLPDPHAIKEKKEPYTSTFHTEFTVRSAPLPLSRSIKMYVQRRRKQRHAG